jgi:serine/threonine protein kinase
VIGQVVSHYKILDKLGEGGMGVVYRAEDTKLKRFVALKFLPPHLAASEGDKARFSQEAQAASALNHPNVCTIHDIQEYDGPGGSRQMFIVMEFVEGKTLREARSTVTFKQAVDLGIQIAEGLSAAHEKGIVHRDIKPDNIMVRKDGIAQVMDFGLAKLAGGVSRLTREGSTVGTAGYMSPEQVQGLEADHRSDIFSLGVLLYELLTGQMPFKGVHETALMYEIVNVDPAPMSSVKPEIDPSLDAVVLECLEKDPRDRYQSAAEVAKDLRKYKRESSRQRASRVSSVRPALQPSGIAPPTGGRDEAAFAPAPVVKGNNRVAPWILSGILFLVAAAAIAYHLIAPPPPAEKPVMKSLIIPPSKTIFNMTNGGHIAVSPDGGSIAFVATDTNGIDRVCVRRIGSLTALALAGTEGAIYPFWSPDSRKIGFFSRGKLKNVEAAGR